MCAWQSLKKLMPSHGGKPLAARAIAAELGRRIELAREDRPDDETGKPSVAKLVGELEVFKELPRTPFRKLDVSKSADPKIVMVLPGFFSHPARMRYMARQIERAGHKTKRWGLGLNLGPTPENLDFLEKRLIQIHRRYKTRPVLLGWSLGGLFARELAKRHPDKVAKVITMGSPFSYKPHANNAWRAYQFVTGMPVDKPPIEGDVKSKPPVETVALWSPRDGVIAPRSACGLPGERDRAIALRCTHIGFTYDPESILAVLKELDNN